MFLDFDKISSQIFINYFLDEYKVLIKTPLNPKKNRNSLILGQFDISNKVYLTQIN